LIGLAADRANTSQEQAILAKKFKRLSLNGISMACGELALVISSPAKALSQCALCILC